MLMLAGNTANANVMNFNLCVMQLHCVSKKGPRHYRL